MVEDHLAEDGVTSEEPADVSVITVTESQEDHVWLTLNGVSDNYLKKNCVTIDSELKVVCEIKILYNGGELP